MSRRLDAEKASEMSDLLREEDLNLDEAKLIGDLVKHDHGVSGEVYALSPRSLLIKNFKYDGSDAEAFFVIGTSGTGPSEKGTILPCPYKGKFYHYNDQDAIGLGRFDGKNVQLTLPEELVTQQIKWISVWSRANSVSFGDLIINKSALDELREFLSQRIKVFLGILVLLLVVLLVIVIAILSSGNGPAERLLNCQGDGFDPLKYTVKEVDGSEKIKFVKIKFVEDTANDEYYIFESARNECNRLDSDLWEIADGKPEWDAISEKAKAETKTYMWLNANATNSNCPGGEKDCRKLEAVNGNGIPVNWPSFPSSTYSRLASAVTDEKRCVYVDNQSTELLWRTGSCTSITAWGLCLKRNCQEE